MGVKKALVPLHERSELELATILQKTEELIDASEAPATRRAHASDWKRFEAWCTQKNVSALPATPGTIAAYLSDQSTALKPATLERRLATISVAHRAAGHDTPTRALIVGKVMAGIRRKYGTKQTKKTPLTIEELIPLARALNTDELVDIRDRAIILVMFGAALRRSEAAALRLEDIEFTRKGFVLTKRWSKTDQAGAGIKVPVSYGDTAACPVVALRLWIKKAKIDKGQLFRGIRHDELTEKIGGRTIALIIKRRVKLLGLDPKKFSGHSLRSGFATTAGAAGLEERLIAKITGHKSMGQLREYIQEGELETSDISRKVGL